MTKILLYKPSEGADSEDGGFGDILGEVEVNPEDLALAVEMFQLLAEPALKHTRQIRDDAKLPVVEQALAAHYRVYTLLLLIAGVEDQKAEVEAEIGNRIYKMVAMVPAGEKKDYKFLGTNQTEQAWSIAGMLPDQHKRLAELTSCLRNLKAQLDFWKMVLNNNGR